VNSLLGEFSRDRKEMARNGRHDRGVFISEMRRQVMGMCKDTADDLMGARLAWRGRSSGKSRPAKVKMPPPVFAAPKVSKQKEKSWLDEKPSKTATKRKRGKK
jgi:hypothetical protein